jgi:hypothetical protein
MKFHLDFYDVPRWLYKLLDFFRVGRIYAIPQDAEKLIDDYIEDGFYENAKYVVEEIEKKYGISTHTVKYTTRIDRMGILGK